MFLCGYYRAAKLAFPDGSIPQYPAPTFPASPFQPTYPSNACVILNAVPNLQSGTAAIFNPSPDTPASPNEGSQAFVSADDIPAANARRYAAWTHNTRELTLLDRRDSLSVRTGTARFEVVTFAPILRDTYAILGIISCFAAASVLSIEESRSGVSVQLAGPGEFAAAFMDRPSKVFCHQTEIHFTWIEETGLHLAILPNIPKPTVFIRF